MNRITVLVILVLGFIQLKSQTIEIGQDAEDIKRLIEWRTKDHNRPDTYGRYSDARASWDVLYNNGQITDVIQCYENQFFVDLRMSANYCNNYIMEYGKLAYTLTQYENISTEKLIKVYDELYKDRKINNLYFDKDYKHYKKIYLAKNGQATIEWAKAEINQIPLNIRKEIEKKQLEKEEEEYQQKLTRQKEKEKEKEIKSKIYDLQENNISLYNATFKDITNEIAKYFKKSSNNNSSNSIPSYYDLANGKEKKYRFTNTYTAYYKLEDHGRESVDYGYYISAGSNDVRQTKEIKLISGNDNSCSLFNSISFKIPTIEIDGYEVMTEATFPNIIVDFAKGITVIKIKSGGINFTNYSPDSDIQKVLIEKLKSEPKGKYILKYEVSNIMGETTVNIETEKVQSSGLGLLKKLGGIALIVMLLYFGAM